MPLPTWPIITITEALFYIFSALIVFSAAMVVRGKNSVHSVLFLIFAFVNAAGIFLLAGAEFLAMILIIVYVGAVAVLFLFVVMMLDVDFAKMRTEQPQKHKILGGLIGFIFLSELFLLIASWQQGGQNSANTNGFSEIVKNAEGGVHNTKALGHVLYTDFLIAFQGAGVVLLIAMIGAIVLTLRYRAGVKKQNIKQQIWRERSDCIELKDVPIGRGTGELTNLEFRN